MEVSKASIHRKKISTRVGGKGNWRAQVAGGLNRAKEAVMRGGKRPPVRERAGKVECYFPICGRERREATIKSCKGF